MVGVEESGFAIVGNPENKRVDRDEVVELSVCGDEAKIEPFS